MWTLFFFNTFCFVLGMVLFCISKYLPGQLPRPKGRGLKKPLVD